MSLRTPITLLIFIVIGLGIYLNALDNPFVYDDDMYVVKNVHVRDAGNIPRFFVSPRLSTNEPRNAGHYRPLVVTSYAVNYALGGLNPVGYHLVNLAFHAGSAFVIFLIVQAMLISGQRSAVSGQQSAVSSQRSAVSGQRSAVSSQRSAVSGQQSAVSSQRSAVSGQQSAVSSQQETDKSAHRLPLTAHYFSALAAGLIFLVHPFNSEAVNYITARSSVMSGFFYLLAFYCWVRFRQLAVSSEQLAVRRKRETDKSAHCSPLTAHRSLLTAHYFYIASLLAFVAGMLSKEVLITLPVVLWLYDLYFYRPDADNVTLRNLLSRRTYLPYLPFLLIVVIPYLFMRFFSFGGVLPHFRRDLWTQILTGLPVLIKHWAMFFLPKDLSLFHDVEIYHEVTLPVFLSGLLLLFAIAAAIFLMRRKDVRWRMVSFFIFWFFIVLLPIVIIPLNAIFQENRGYLAIVSFAVLGGVFAGEMRRRRFKTATTAVVILLLVVYSGITFQRNVVWGDAVSLWRDVIRKAPLSGAGYASLTAIYRERGHLNLSLETAKRGLSIDPDNYYIRFNLGRTYFVMGELDKAIEEYEKALEIDPARPIIWNELALIYTKKGDLERSERHLKRAIRMWGDLPPLHYNLGVILVERGKFTEGVEEFKKAVALYPEYLRARHELAGVYERLGRAGEAQAEYREIIHLASVKPEERLFMYGQNRAMIGKIVEESRRRTTGIKRIQ